MLAPRVRRPALVAATALLGLAALSVLAPHARPSPQDQHAKPGYTDTPMLPGGKWHVHDPDRPRPRVVTPGAAGEPVRAPSDAIVLFDGKDLSRWTSDGKPAQWKIEHGYAEVNGTGDVETKDAFGDCQLHLEWCAPTPASGEGQGRGNSGVFFMQRYEVQILDCFENLTYPDGQTAALYGQFPPLVNACRKPGEWQTYDIVFEAPRFEGEKLAKPARITVFHNGVLVHLAREVVGATQHREVATYAVHPAKLPIRLQDHGNPVRFRNIWIREIGES